MTANAFEEDKRDALAVGMNGHIAKPIELDKLLSMLAEVIKQQENCLFHVILNGVSFWKICKSRERCIVIQKS